MYVIQLELLGCSFLARAVYAAVVASMLESHSEQVMIVNVQRILDIGDEEWNLAFAELNDLSLLHHVAADKRFVVAMNAIELFAVALGSPGRPKASDWAELREIVIERDGGDHCTYCHSTDGPFVLDHVHPIALGGSNHPTNLFVACESCNSRKGARAWEDWLPILEEIKAGRA